VPVDRGWPVRIGDLSIAVFRVDEQLVAVENVCRHVGNPIDDGFVERGCVTCPWHGWRYDLRTGDHLTFFGRRPGLRTYPVRTDGEDVLIEVD
jgi:nitrite reductase/ring-hydroxylating ferredoxin subunit